MNDKTDHDSSVKNKESQKKGTAPRLKKDDKPPKPVANDSSSSGSKILGIISLFGLLLLAATVIFFVQKGKQELVDIKQSEMSQSSYVEETNEQLQQLSKKNESHSKTINQIADKQTALEEALSSIENRPDSNLDWALMEVEHLIVIAMHRLLLERDVKTAIVALESADRRLKDIANPALIPVREQIAIDMNSLKAINLVDRTGLSLFLADLITRAESLPLKKQMISVNENKTQETEQLEEQNNWKDLPVLVWEELKSLVVIKHKDEEGAAFLLPEEEYYLYQNLRLQLENARLSVLNLDSENLKASIDIITNWLKDHFNTNETAVTNVLETLAQMKTVDLKPELPDINSSLETLHVFMKTHDAETDNVPGS